MGQTRVGVNGVYDMGGNIWEWASDASGSDRLTMGGSWWKMADFSAVYIGLRWAYPN